MKKLPTKLRKVKKPLHGPHREDIKAEIRKLGLSLAQIGRDAGYSRTATVATINHAWWPNVERIIADVLNTEPWMLWPERYNDYGQPVAPGNENRIKKVVARHKLKTKLQIVK